MLLQSCRKSGFLASVAAALIGSVSSGISQETPNTQNKPDKVVTSSLDASDTPGRAALKNLKEHKAWIALHGAKPGKHDNWLKLEQSFEEPTPGDTIWETPFEKWVVNWSNETQDGKKTWLRTSGSTINISSDTLGVTYSTAPYDPIAKQFPHEEIFGYLERNDENVKYSHVHLFPPSGLRAELEYTVFRKPLISDYQYLPNPVFDRELPQPIDLRGISLMMRYEKMLSNINQAKSGEFHGETVRVVEFPETGVVPERRVLTRKYWPNKVVSYTEDCRLPNQEIRDWTLFYYSVPAKVEDFKSEWRLDRGLTLQHGYRGKFMNFERVNVNGDYSWKDNK